MFCCLTAKLRPRPGYAGVAQELYASPRVAPALEQAVAHDAWVCCYECEGFSIGRGLTAFAGSMPGAACAGGVAVQGVVVRCMFLLAARHGMKPEPFVDSRGTICICKP